jgi:hypothetical protein
MRSHAPLVVTFGLLAFATLVMAQGPPGLREGPPESPDEFAVRMMAFDKDRDGKLTRAEITDARLVRLFDRADADKDGVVTKQELTALATKETANDRNGPGGFGPPPGGRGGFGPPGGGPRGPMMALTRPGEVLPPFLRRELRLTDEQAKQLDELQKDVDDRLAKILTQDQRRLLEEIWQRPSGPAGFRRDPGGPPPRAAR